MNLKRIIVLVSKEFRYGSKNMVFFFAIIVPVVLSLAISLMVGTAGRPRLGVVDLGDSRLVENLFGLDYIRLRVYQTPDALYDDVSIGALDMGIVLPSGFDSALQQGATPNLDLYTWGESLLSDRTTLGGTLVRQLILLSGTDSPVETNTILLGEAPSIPWDIRLFPILMVATIALGGLMVPATFIVEEKQKRTMQAILITPVTTGEVIIAKGVAGAMISIVMGVIILTINNAWGARPLILLILLVLSALLATTGGLIIGILIKDINTLFTAIKSIGILLYAPAILYLFPEVPSWIRQIFPSYYMIGPIVEVSLNNAGWGDIAVDVIILFLLIVVMIVMINMILRRVRLVSA